MDTIIIVIGIYGMGGILCASIVEEFCLSKKLTTYSFLGILFFWPLFILKAILYVIIGPFVMLVKYRVQVMRLLSKWWVIPRTLGYIVRDTGKMLIGKD